MAKYTPGQGVQCDSFAPPMIAARLLRGLGVAALARHLLTSLSMNRWLVFFPVVAIIAAVAALGFFDGSHRALTDESAGQVGISKFVLLSVFAVFASVFIAVVAYIRARRERTLRMSNNPRSRPTGPSRKVGGSRAGA